MIVQPTKTDKVAGTGFSENTTPKILVENQKKESQPQTNPLINLLHKYSENSPGEFINRLQLPRWLKSFSLLVTHLTPLVGSISILKKFHLPKQLNSLIGLASMYLGVWGNKNLESFPKISALTIGSSFLCDCLKMPDMARRSLIGLILTAGQEIDFSKIKDKAMLVEFAKKLGLKILQTEVKVNSSIPLADLFSKKISNPFFSQAVKILSLSGIITACSETFNAIGLIDKNKSEILAVASGCPICNGAVVGECISAEIGPIASMQDQLHMAH